MLHNGTQQQSNHKLGYAWLIWVLAACVYLVEYFARVAPGIMAERLIQVFQVNATMLGSLSAFFYIGYVSMQVPVGILIDRFSVRWLLGGSTIICGLSVVLFALAEHLGQAQFARLIMGFAAAFAFIGALKIARLWFPVTMLGFLVGATQSLGMLGGAFGEGPVSDLAKHIGWQNSILAIALIIITLGFLLAILVKDRKQAGLNKAKEHGILSGLACVLRNPLSWLNALIVATLYAPTTCFAELWGPAYFHRVHNLSMPVAAGAISFVFIGWAVAGPITGAISDKLGIRKPILIASCALSLAFVSIILYVPSLSLTTICALLFCFGASSTGVVLNYTIASEINPAEVAGTSIAFANMASIALGALMQPLIGLLLDWNLKNNLHNLSDYSSHDFHIAMLTLPICIGIGLLAAIIMPETCSKQQP